MTKFKVGDKVKVIANTAGCDEMNAGWHVLGQGVVNIGAIGVIESISDGFAIVEFDTKDVEGGTTNDTSRELRFDEIKLINLKPSKNQRITKLEETVAKQGEEINELKLIVEKIRKPSTIVQEALADESVEEKTHFNVGDTVKVVANTSLRGNPDAAGWHFGGQGIVKIGAIGKVTSIDGDFVTAEFNKEDVDTTPSSLLKKLRKDEIELVVNESSADTIEFEGDQYKKVDREAREGDVVILRYPAEESYYVKNNTPYKVVKGKEGELFLIDTNVASLYDSYFRRSKKTVEVYELIVENKQKSPNQLRAEIIEKAKGFVEKHTTPNSRNPDWKALGGITYKCYAVIPEFIVNAEKRIITLLLKGASPQDGRIKNKYFAKCNPSDVFNEHIGKAIALGRALGLDASEFEQAVQPNEVVVGHIVEFFMDDGSYHNTLEVGYVTMDSKIEIRAKGCEGNLSFTPFEIECGDKIINDTNAIYCEGVE